MRSKFKWIFTLLVALSMQFSFAQEKTVTGVVTDGKLPLPGANVIIKGSSKGSSTDMDGKFSIKAKAGDVLEISSIGYDKKTVTVGAANSYNVSLKETAKVLDEVLVTGALGIKRKPDAVTSSQQTVRTKELTQASNPNVIQSLAGKVSGLQVNTISNGVNADTRIELRGKRSISGNNQALVVIDGAISSAGVLAQLPPEIVENVNVIKGAQGAALYGEQGANGVIIVTTKRGNNKSRMTVDVNSSVDFEEISFLPERQTTYGQGWFDDTSFSYPGTDPRSGVGHVAWENGAWGPAFTDPDFAGTMVPVGLPQADGNFLMTKWESLGDKNIKPFFQTGTTYQTGVTVNVGGEDGYALLNIKKESRDFVVPGDKLNRTSFLFKAGKKFNKFSIDGNANFINQKTTETDGGLFDDLLQAGTNIDVQRFANVGHANHWTVYAFNPYRLREQVRFNTRTNVFNGVLTLGYKFNKNINATYTANAQIRHTDSDQHDDGVNVGDYAYDLGGYSYAGNQFETYADLGGQAQGSSFYTSQNIGRNYYGDLIVNFDYDLTKDVNLKLNVGNNIQDSYSRTIQNGGTNLDVPGFYNITNVLNPAQPSTLVNRILTQRRVAYFGNTDIAYKDFLFLNATARYEETSTLSKGFFYPSVGVSFVPTKAFSSLKGGKVLNFAKISANIVKNGNSTPVGIFGTNKVASVASGFPFGDLAGLQYNRNPTNPNIRPEFVTTKELNLGLGFFNDRITFDGSIYVADTKDLITATTASTASGLSTVNGNIGSLQNKGFEIDLGLVPVKTKDFTWSMKGSYTTFKTVIKSLAEGNNSVNLQSNTFIGIFAEVGEEFPLIKGTAYQRDPSGNILVDANGFPLRTSTFEKLGKATPDYIVNFSNTFTYKGFQLTAVMDYRTGHQIYSEQYPRLAVFGYDVESATQDRNVGYVVPNSVQQVTPGVYTENTTPVGGGGYSAVLNYFSNRYSRTGEALILDATALKIRELALSYNLPAKYLKNTGIQAFKVGVNARNPFVFLAKNNKGYTDPEASNTTGNAQGISDIGQYPTTRTYGFSVNVTF